MANVTKELVLNETFMSTEQTPRNVADILADELENIANAIEGGGSGGHIIQDASGTDLAQESKLQFGGMLKTTDDSTNGVTKVSDLAEEVDWSVWNAMTEAQRTAYSAGKKLDIINVPSVSGSIPVELIKTLWTNSDPSATFAPQNITLASDDYDFLYVVCTMSTSISREITSLIEAESTGFITTTFAATGGINMYQRTIQYTSKTVLSITDAYKITNGAYGGVDNTIIIPTAIYGIKSSVNVDMSALVANVSTSANKCMLSDGETSVEDALDRVNEKIKDKPSITPVTGVTAVVKNGILFVDLVNIIISSTGWIDVVTLPEGYRPSKPCYTAGVSPTDFSSVLFYVGVAGNIQIRGNSSTSKGYTGNICVPIAND